MLGDGYLRIAVLWQEMQIANYVNKLLLLMRKKEENPTSNVMQWN